MFKNLIKFSSILLCISSLGLLYAQNYEQDEFYDTLSVENTSDSLQQQPQSQLPVDQKTHKIKVKRREFNYRSQVGGALGMMLFFAIILTTVQSWNPD